MRRKGAGEKRGAGSGGAGGWDPGADESRERSSPRRAGAQLKAREGCAEDARRRSCSLRPPTRPPKLRAFPTLRRRADFCAQTRRGRTAGGVGGWDAGAYGSRERSRPPAPVKVPQSPGLSQAAGTKFSAQAPARGRSSFPAPPPPPPPPARPPTFLSPPRSFPALPRQNPKRRLVL